jgi:hypothetical protein
MWDKLLNQRICWHVECKLTLRMPQLKETRGFTRNLWLRVSKWARMTTFSMALILMTKSLQSPIQRLLKPRLGGIRWIEKIKSLNLLRENLSWLKTVWIALMKMTTNWKLRLKRSKIRLRYKKSKIRWRSLQTGLLRTKEGVDLSWPSTVLIAWTKTFEHRKWIDLLLITYPI